MPVIRTRPQEHLSFDQTVIAIQTFDDFHLFLCQRILRRTLKIFGVVFLLERERGSESALSAPPISGTQLPDGFHAPLQWL